MDANRFDSITRLFAARRTRRQANATGGAGVAPAGLLAAGLGRAAAQDAAAMYLGGAVRGFTVTDSPDRDTGRCSTAPGFILR